MHSNGGTGVDNFPYLLATALSQARAPWRANRVLMVFGGDEFRYGVGHNGGTGIVEMEKIGQKPKSIAPGNGVKGLA